MKRNLQLQKQAEESLNAVAGHRKLILIHGGITALLALVLELINVLLNSGIAQTGGLSGMNTRSLLETIQQMLILSQMVLLPFWAAGYTATTLRIAKEKEAKPSDLLTGFRYFWPVLRLQILIWIITLVAAFLCVQVITLIISFTPVADSLYTKIMPLLQGMDPANLDLATQEAIVEAMLPMIGIVMLFSLLVLLPLSYYLRLAMLRLLDAPRQGARLATRISIRLMRGNCLRLFRLDLHFWWFYLAQVLVLLLAYGGEILTAIGVVLPMSATGVFFLFYALSLGAELVLFYFWRNQVEVTYAQFYLDLLPKEEPHEESQTVL